MCGGYWWGEFIWDFWCFSGFGVRWSCGLNYGLSIEGWGVVLGCLREIWGVKLDGKLGKVVVDDCVVEIEW